MVKQKIYVMVVILASLIMLGAVYVIGHDEYTSLKSAQKGDTVVFTGLCVYSKGDFSVLTNGYETVMVYRNLTEGRIYTIRGKLTDKERRALYPLEIANGSAEELLISNLSGVYWVDYNCYILIPQKVKLNKCLNIQKGAEVNAKGVLYGNTFYILSFEVGDFLAEPKDGFPYRVVGVVINNGTPTVIWNGKEKVKVYLPYKFSLNLGDKVEILGIARLYSTLTLYVNSPDDVKLIGKAKRKPLGEENVGDIVYGSCQVVKSGRSLGLNCTDLKLYSFSARIGDIIKFEALRRERSLVCLNCSVKLPREKLENSICSPERAGIIKIEGKVSWVKIYKNGFGLANITNGDCWILLKLKKSLNLEFKENQTVTAFGVYTTYREKPALELLSGEDICLENSCLGS
ncbi:hypothetical protein E3E31_06685 [Thermococcus sp. M39]|uniref:hypothetical protein n=1 Tax=unclassified Thermococcus TaxID=2627626 RepID=UPI0014389173|nr:MULTISPECIES: hypothetical protein [unclassified Thermococcus]NJE08209.1 hypothetical protein [Thermococcus sp. M39]NJE11702.1 hypothetical protein [Thermococcus sp. LS2]